MATDTPAADIHRAIDAVWRIEQARLIAGLARMVRDVGLAEELAQDALIAALEQWPAVGHSGQARRLADGHRQKSRHRPAAPRTSWRAQARGDRPRARGRAGRARRRSRRSARRRYRRRSAAPDVHRLSSGALHRGARRADAAPDRRPTTDEIARAFLVPEPTVAQRIVRAKRTLAEAARALRGAARRGARRRVSRRCWRSSTSFSTKATRRRPATTGCGRSSARRRCGSAASWPGSRRDEPEVHGLVALMEIQASRFAARTSPSGEPMLLLDQNRARWDQLLIRRGLAALDHAETRRALRAAAGPLHAASGDRGLPCAGAHGGGDRLAADRRALRRAWPSSRRRRWSSSIARWRWRSRWPGGRARARRRSGGGAGAQDLSSAAERARRSW